MLDTASANTVTQLGLVLLRIQAGHYLLGNTAFDTKSGVYTITDVIIQPQIRTLSLKGSKPLMTSTDYVTGNTLRDETQPILIANTFVQFTASPSPDAITAWKSYWNIA
jgi:hypothetical protein